MEKLLQLINDLENIEDFIKVNAFDKTKRELSEQDCAELLRLISEAKTRALK